MNNKLDKVHKAVAQRAERLIDLLKEKGYRPFITQGYRSVSEQDALYAQGRTKPGSRVTNAKGGQSWHNWGCAFDLGFLTSDGKLTYDVNWNEVGKLGESLGLEWGGRWLVFKDKPHFQLTANLSLSALQRSNSPIHDVATALDPFILAENKPSEWASSSVQWCIDNGVATDWRNPQGIADAQTIEIMLSRAGLIQEVSGLGLSKERWAVLIKKLSK